MEYQPTTPEPIQLRTRHDVNLLIDAIESREADLLSLAKKNNEGGYPREARSQLADAAALKQFILPQLRDQQELPLVTLEDLKLRIGEALRGDIGGHLIVRTPADQQEDALRTRENKLLEILATKITAFALEIAQSSYSAGYAARSNDPEELAARAINVLYGDLR